MEILFTTRVFKEGRSYVAHAIELDVSSCAGSEDKAIRNLKEAGYSKDKQKFAPPKVIGVQRM